MTDTIRNRQLPGRQEALRMALGKPAEPLMKHIAGLDKKFEPMQDGVALTTLRINEKLTDEERETLHF